MTRVMTYEEALNWIHSKLAFGIKPGLERMHWLLEQLGNPQDKLKAVHVVGTNGKGSTVNYLKDIFCQAGYEVGTFTSPYIVDFKERISLNGQMISEEAFLDLVNQVAPVVERLPLETDLEPATEFEVITTLMFYYFGQKRPVDLVIVEAGLGGLYDSTNVFTPLAVLCPSIGLDHQAILGDSHVAIAKQKAGVLKEGVPFLYATDRSDVKEVFEQVASSRNSPSFALGRDYVYKGQTSDFAISLSEVGKRKLATLAGSEILEGLTALSDLHLAMLGEHQLSNASLAVLASLVLQPHFPKLSPSLIKPALADSRWLGRTEWLRPNLMIDGAHNNESIEALVNLLRKDYADKSIHILFAAIDTKPVDEMLKQLEGFASLTVTTFPYPNSISLAAYPDRYDKVTSFEEWLGAVQDDSNHLYIVTGSLYFISQVRKWLLQHDHYQNLEGVGQDDKSS